jgi:hypothetical protein
VLVVDDGDVTEAAHRHLVQHVGDRRARGEVLGIRGHHVADRQRRGVAALVDDPEQHVALGEDPDQLAAAGPVVGHQHAAAVLALHRAHRLGDGRARRERDRALHRHHAERLAQQARVESVGQAPRRLPVGLVAEIIAYVDHVTLRCSPPARDGRHPRGNPLCTTEPGDDQPTGNSTQ